MELLFDLAKALPVALAILARVGSLGLRAEWEKYYRLGQRLSNGTEIDRLSVGLRLQFR